MKANLDNDKYFLNLVRIGYLKVYRDGSIRNLKTGKTIGENQKGDGYIALRHKDASGRMRCMQAHRLVYQVFSGRRITNAALQVNHKDGVKRNNRPSNLELVSSRENTNHAVRLGLLTAPSGQYSGNASLSDAEAAWIREQFALGRATVYQLASMFCVSRTTVYNLIRGSTY